MSILAILIVLTALIFSIASGIRELWQCNEIIELDKQLHSRLKINKL